MRLGHGDRIAVLRQPCPDTRLIYNHSKLLNLLSLRA